METESFILGVLWTLLLVLDILFLREIGVIKLF